MISGRRNWKSLRIILPYLKEYRWRVVLALTLLFLAKMANVSVPLVLKAIVDAMNQPTALLTLPLALLIGYGALRLANSAFGELRDGIFAKVTQHTVRRVALQTFQHLHALSLRYHLERQTGGLSRDMERGSRGIGFVLQFMLFNVLPTIVEIGLVAAILITQYSYWFAVITLLTLALYVTYTLSITEWRMRFRRTMNEMDSRANTRALDSLINYETVKYFGNETHEARQYDNVLESWEKAAVQSQVSLAVLNAGQGIIIACGITLLMILAAHGVAGGTMTIGDLVLVNAYLIQLYIPLNSLGFVYREMKNSFADMERMFSLLDINVEIRDQPDARPIHIENGTLEFDRVSFGYMPDRQILFDVSFTVSTGETVAIVGASGSGKSTLSRLLFRFYDVTHGAIRIDGQDIRNVTQASLRSAIGIVPQDTVLFNDTIFYNIAYGRPNATRDEVVAAAQYAHIHHFIESLPVGYNTVVGERGLKLSGGEKQRIAIGRAILKNPRIFVFDEATSSLDSKSEKAIQADLQIIAQNRTTIMIAHRLSTIVDADQILVMDRGRIVERGSHRALLALDRLYAHMWSLQQQQEESGETGAVPSTEAAL
jgi:ATP-binding cassette subfamily B protein